MKKYGILLSIFLMSTAFADNGAISNAKITSVNFWGEKQVTVYFDKAHGISCPNTNSHKSAVAFDSTTESGKSYLSAFLMAYAVQKNVSLTVTNTPCNGDRPTIHTNFTISG